MKKVIFLLLMILLSYTRLSGLTWSYPYPFHPDENNMVNSVQSLRCEGPSIKDCLNPHFFAYGQPPVYAAYIISKVMPMIDHRLALRLISAFASILNAIVLIKMFQLFIKKKPQFSILIYIFLIVIFSPYFIQFSHFGTTESILMFVYSLITYFLLSWSKNDDFSYENVSLVGLSLGFAVAIKLSSLVFILPFICVLIFSLLRRQSSKKIVLRIKTFLFQLALLFIIGVLSYALFSPHNLISWNDFMSSMKYEIGVGNGSLKVFYTQQFEGAQPVLFQLQHIFPYVLGLSQYLLILFGLSAMVFRRTFQDKILLLSILIYFVPVAFLYAKWTRFMSPIFPLLTVCALIGLHNAHDVLMKKFENRAIIVHIISFVIVIITIIPGIAHMSIYSQKDVRVEASEWIDKNIPQNSRIISEAGNVVDIPMNISQRFNIASFDFYNVDKSSSLKYDLQQYKNASQYIFVPSRRVFADYTCMSPDKTYKQNISTNQCQKLQKMYPILSRYYQEIFSEEGSFKHIKTFTSYPRISLLGKTLLEFPDEQAEETWTVFDHPVVRIYKKR